MDKIDCDKCNKQLCMDCVKHISKIGGIKVCKNLCLTCFENFCEIPCCGIFVDLKNNTKCYKCNKPVNILSHFT